MKRDLQFTASLYPLGLARYMAHVRSIGQFLADADAGTLPGFSIVDPDFDEYSEENPQDVRKGESFACGDHQPGDARQGLAGHPADLDLRRARRLLRPRRAAAAVEPDDTPGPQPGRAPVAAAQRAQAAVPGLRPARRAAGLRVRLRYDTYGVRVPAVIVSPFARPDCVLSEVFDHTSVLKLVEEKWNLPALTRRDAAASSPLGALDLSAPPAFLTPPRAARPEPGLGLLVDPEVLPQPMWWRCA